MTAPDPIADKNKRTEALWLNPACVEALARARAIGGQHDLSFDDDDEMGMAAE